MSHTPRLISFALGFNLSHTAKLILLTLGFQNCLLFRDLYYARWGFQLTSYIVTFLARSYFFRYGYGYHHLGYRNDLRQHHVNAIALAAGAGIGTAEVDGVPGTLSGVHPAYGYDPTFGYGAYPYHHGYGPHGYYY